MVTCWSRWTEAHRSCPDLGFDCPVVLLSVHCCHSGQGALYPHLSVTWLRGPGSIDRSIEVSSRCPHGNCIPYPFTHYSDLYIISTRICIISTHICIISTRISISITTQDYKELELWLHKARATSLSNLAIS